MQCTKKVYEEGKTGIFYCFKKQMTSHNFLKFNENVTENVQTLKG